VVARPELSWDDFAKLRLLEFVPGSSIRTLRDWEFMEHVWVGEAAGFTEWLRRRDDPKVLRSMALDLDALEERVVDAILNRVSVPLHAGMTRKRLERLLGEPTRVQAFPKAPDRETLIYDGPASPGGYRLSCTVKKRGGLTYLVIMCGDWEGSRSRISRSMAGKRRRTPT
jgi:hypothetical protein